MFYTWNIKLVYSGCVETWYPCLVWIIRGLALNEWKHHVRSASKPPAAGYRDVLARLGIYAVFSQASRSKSVINPHPVLTDVMSWYLSGLCFLRSRTSHISQFLMGGVNKTVVISVSHMRIVPYFFNYCHLQPPFAAAAVFSTQMLAPWTVYMNHKAPWNL